MTMHEPLRDWIHTQTPSLGLQLLASVVVIGSVVALSVIALKLDDRYKERWDPAILETVAGLVVGGSALGGMAIVVMIWRTSEQVLSALRVMDLDPLLVLLTVFTMIAAYAMTRLTRRFAQGFAPGTSAVTDHQREVFHHILQVLVYLFALLVILSLWRVDVRNLLLGAGVLGIVLGLAARQTLGAVLAGFVVLFSRPFEVGDWVVIEEHEGTVRDITIVNTRIQTFDGETVMVPNDIVTGTQVVNRSREGRLRVNLDVNVDYEEDIPAAVSAAEEAMAAVEEAKDSPTPRAVVAEFDDSSVVLRLRFWIDNPTARRYWRVRTSVSRAVREAFRQEDIKIPFPQRELSGRGDGAEMSIQMDDAPVPPAPEDEAADSEEDDESR